jgi:dCTP deaminase
MIPNAGHIARKLASSPKDKDPLIITPMPDLKKLQGSGEASLDLRLGCWFLVCRQTRLALLDVYNHPDDVPNEAKQAKTYYVPLGQYFILHPRAFVLGVTLEWIRLPADYAAYVIGMSRWGRHGLIIATATGVHPRFTGCLTLELSNVGEIPIKIKPGTTICQIFFHRVEGDKPESFDRSVFIGRRKPLLGAIKLDEIARQLQSGVDPNDTDL